MPLFHLDWSLFSSAAQESLLLSAPRPHYNCSQRSLSGTQTLCKVLKLCMRDFQSQSYRSPMHPVSTRFTRMATTPGQLDLQSATWRQRFWSLQTAYQLPLDPVFNIADLHQPGPAHAIFSGVTSQAVTRLQPLVPQAKQPPVAWFRLQFFVLLLNMGWHFFPTPVSGRVGSHSPLLASRVKTRGGLAVYSVGSLWIRWINLFSFLFNCFFYCVRIFSFGQLSHKYLIDALNWGSWADSLAAWKYTHFFFYFKYLQHNHATIEFLERLRPQLGGVCFFVNTRYHYHALRLFSTLNLYTVGLCDLTIEPWLCWYPVFCRGFDKTLQHVFLLLLLRLKLLGGQLYFTSVRFYVRHARLLWRLSKQSQLRLPTAILW